MIKSDVNKDRFLYMLWPVYIINRRDSIIVGFFEL
jgi:hypothetical protein